jgi:hypothetical protein
VIIGRRTFIQISAPFVATAAALAMLPSRLLGVSSSQLAGGKQDIWNIAFRIHGWDRRDESAGNDSKTSPAGSVTGGSDSDEVFFSINQSWRTAWR